MSFSSEWLTEAALDLTQVDLVDGLDKTFEVLRRAYKAHGVTHVDLEQSAREEAGYLYGLAVGVALGKGSAR